MAASDWLPAAVRAAGIERRLKAGQTLFRLGDRTAGLYEIVRGKVRLARVDASGREAILHVASAGDTIAEASLFSPTYHCDAIATGDALVRLYPKAAVLAAFAARSEGCADLHGDARPPGHEPANAAGAAQHPFGARSRPALPRHPCRR